MRRHAPLVFVAVLASCDDGASALDGALADRQEVEFSAADLVVHSPDGLDGDEPDALRDASPDAASDARDAVADEADVAADAPEDAAEGAIDVAPDRSEAASDAGPADVFDATVDREDLPELGTREQPAPAVQVAVSYFTACMVLADGSLWCWGNNLWGDVGDGTQEDRATPVRILDRDVVKVTLLGPDCALRTNGDIYCWGNNGTGTVTGRPLDPPTVLRPTRVEGLPRALDVATSASISCMIAEDRRVWCWGQRGAPIGSVPAPFSDLRDVARLSLSHSLRCAVLTNGRVRCWGPYDVNECGRRATMGTCAGSWPDPPYVDDIDDAVDVVVGNDVACAIRRDRSLWCWGGNNNGQLGAPSSDVCSCTRDGVPRIDYSCAWSPQRVPLPGPVAQVDVSERYARVCAVLMDGTLWCWGQDVSQTEVAPTYVPCTRVCFDSGSACRPGPARIYSVTDATEVGVGTIACLRRRGGDVRCWRSVTAPSTFTRRWY